MLSDVIIGLSWMLVLTRLKQVLRQAVQYDRPIRDKALLAQDFLTPPLYASAWGRIRDAVHRLVPAFEPVTGADLAARPPSIYYVRFCRNK